jgi:glycerate kinase
MKNPSFLIVPDSFKGCMPSKDVSINILKGIKSVFPNSKTQQISMADGGEGTIESISQNIDGKKVFVKVHDPINRVIDSFFYIIDNGRTAIIEMALAGGIELLNKNEHNPLITSSYGVGELIKQALDFGCKKIIIGLGGSATNDAGIGMAKALGVKFYDINNNELNNGGGNLNKLSTIDISNLDKRLLNTDIIAATDVSATLTGKNGASFLFAKQKGASDKEIELLDNNLTHFADIINKQFDKNITNIKGGGAAGGLGAGLSVFCNAKIESGFHTIAKLIDLESKIANSDIIITAEGRVDEQTILGKTPIGIAKLSKKYNKPVFVLTGNATINTDILNREGISSIIPITRKPTSLDTAIKNAPIWIEKSAEMLCQIIKYSIQ